ncbi:YgfZ/GcvT domain-containing protein [Dongia sp.]|uniref:CAF17-like 4Fe-4S cluster assembly/insertion protein YgfZ n=1 Tax=Dongia sp. TaxID=1977262 RepID=UPI003753B467
MTNTDFFAIDTFRSPVAVEGEDRQTFLQGLISNDTQRVSQTQAIFSAFLTAQGKFLHDFSVAEVEGRYLLDPETERRADLIKRLSMYRLRSKVKVVDAAADWAVVVFAGPGALARLGLAPTAGLAKPLSGGVVFVDPRLPALGARAFLPRAEAEATARNAGFSAAPIETFEQLRVALGVPSGSRDLIPDKGILLENGFEELHAIDWDKGCYMGQELTARTRYRGLVRKRLLPVEISGAAPAPGTALMLGGVEAGELRSLGPDGKSGLAMVRLEHLDRARAEGLTAGEATLRPSVPDWMRLPEQVG